jgi:hypothetical protein
MRNCDINQKFNLSSSTAAAVRKGKARITEAVKKAYPLLSAVKLERSGLAAEMENVPILWAYDRNCRRAFLNLRSIQRNVKFPMLLCPISGNNIDNFYYILSVLVILGCIYGK